MSKSNSGRIIGISKKNAVLYTKENFSMYSSWFKEFFMIHHKIYNFIGENLENFYRNFDNKFFDWFNQPKNLSKFMFEVKKVFMEMADEILLQEIMIERLKNSENRFVIPVFQEDSRSINESDVEIDSYSDPEPCYNLMEERQILQENISDIESSNYDDEFYLSFFVKN